MFTRGLTERYCEMKLFYQFESDEEKLTEKIYKSYGLFYPARKDDFAISFLFTPNEVYISDELDAIIARDKPFSEFLFGTLYRFMIGDFGLVSTVAVKEKLDPDDEMKIGLYPSEYGDIQLKILQKNLLIQIKNK